MNVDWIATDPQTGRLSLTEQRSSTEEYLARIEALRVLGWGYSEVSRSDAAYPHLTLSFKAEHAVVHQFSAADEVLLLAGDGVIADKETVALPILDDIDGTPFTGAFVLRTTRACAAIAEFLRRGRVEDLGNWQQL
jgi:hypothetical protein